MTQNQTQEMMKQATNLMNGDYKAPGKLLLWGLCKALHNPHYAKETVMRSK